MYTKAASLRKRIPKLRCVANELASYFIATSALWGKHELRDAEVATTGNGPFRKDCADVNIEVNVVLIIKK